MLKVKERLESKADEHMFDKGVGFILKHALFSFCFVFLLKFFFFVCVCVFLFLTFLNNRAIVTPTTIKYVINIHEQKLKRKRFSSRNFSLRERQKDREEKKTKN